MTQPVSDVPSSLPVNSRQSIVRRFVSDLFRLPHWQKTVLTVALAAVGLGWTHQAYHALTDSGPAATQNSPSSANPQAMNSTDQSGTSAIARWSRRVGASVLVGFIVGWAFRTFVKMMAAVSAAIVAVFCLLSYFNVMNVDFTSMEKKSTTATAWVTDQGKRIRDAAMAHSHSTIGGFLGIVMGVRKKVR